MRDQIVETAASIDRQLAEIAVSLAGGRDQAALLLQSIATEQHAAIAMSFLIEAGALLRARQHLSAALAG